MSIFNCQKGKYSVLTVGFPTCRHGLIYVWYGILEFNVPLDTRKNLNPVCSLNKSKMNSNAINKFIKPFYR